MQRSARRTARSTPRVAAKPAHARRNTSPQHTSKRTIATVNKKKQHTIHNTVSHNTPTLSSSPSLYTNFNKIQQKRTFSSIQISQEAEQIQTTGDFLTFKPVDVPLALHYAKSFSTSVFPHSIMLSLNLGLDPRKPNQMVRGMAPVPHNSGGKSVVAVFASGDKAAEATAAGADIVGSEDLIKEVIAGNIRFTRCLATPDMMRHLARVARILGPKGLMPNPKMGTVTNDIGKAVSDAKQGQIAYRCDKKGVVHAMIGKSDWTVEKLEENANAFIRAIDIAKPSGAKGTYFKSAYIGSQNWSTPLNTRNAPFRM